jgi:hypothetical protein
MQQPELQTQPAIGQTHLPNSSKPGANGQEAQALQQFISHPYGRPFRRRCLASQRLLAQLQPLLLLPPNNVQVQALIIIIIMLPIKP